MTRKPHNRIMKAGAGRGSQGFTLVEIMIVVATIGVLATIAIPSFLKARQTARVTTTVKAIQTIEGAISRYMLDAGNCPYRSWPDNMWGLYELPFFLEGYLKEESWNRGTPDGGSFSYTMASVGYVQGNRVMWLHPLRISGADRSVMEDVARELCGESWTSNAQAYKCWWSGDTMMVTLFVSYCRWPMGPGQSWNTGNQIPWDEND